MITDEHYLSNAFSSAVDIEEKKFFGNLEAICCGCYDTLSHRVDVSDLQDSSAVRNTLRTRALAIMLINSEGKLQTDLLPLCRQYFEKSLFSFGQGRHIDVTRHEHILEVIARLQEDPQYVRILFSVDKPYANPMAEQIIRDTLALPVKAAIGPVEVRRAVLAAWLAYLRQSVGSCFATAPAIIVLDEQPKQFLKDIIEMLSTGRLKRTFAGVEYAAPLCYSSGSGDLKRPQIYTKEQVFLSPALNAAPGYIAAFTAANLLDSTKEAAERQQQADDLLLQVLRNAYDWEKSIIWTTPEDLIRKVVLDHLGLQERDLAETEHQTMAPLIGGVVLDKGIGGSGSAVQAFIPLFSRCCAGFKGLAENALLKCWEFTVASFAETKPSFSKWNLYASLGLDPREKGGIGQSLYTIISDRFERAKVELNELHYEYEQVVSRIHQLGSRINSAGSESEARWLKGEYQTKQVELYNVEQLHSGLKARVERYSNLFDELIDQYTILFPRYFQEVYDPDIREVSVGPYDDSPAGFHLVYKHGRENSAQWSVVGGAVEFTNYLVDFFIATERVIAADIALEGKDSRILSDIVTAVVSHIKTDEFLETALRRMAAAHNAPLIERPLENLDKVEKKPWVYTSGGTMGSLVSCYFRREEAPTESARWVENPMELLVFLIDIVKQLPPNESALFLKNPNKSLLIHSPTHAFLFKPGWTPFNQCWQNNEFTYTWVRDNIFLPRERFVSGLLLDEAMMFYLVEKFSLMVPADYRHYFLRVFSRFFGVMPPDAFRAHVVDMIRGERALQHRGQAILSEEAIDSALYKFLPLFPAGRLCERVNGILAATPQLDASVAASIGAGAADAMDRLPGGHLMDADTLYKGMLGLLCKAACKPYSPIDLPKALMQAAQQLGYAMPAPIFFSDTNWMRDLFAFVVNPGTASMDLWRMDRLGFGAAPMAQWRPWLDGSRRDRQWGVYTRSFEYIA